ncbi:MAG TPA: Mur ligase family protein, partial [Verrucomicrobiae bacterium]|nr:Mur ligase family protein [Verrucomicrobiae bacterium]
MLENLVNKKIAILGLGVNNRQLADYLTQKGITFEVVDGWTSNKELADKIIQFDLVFRTPGIPVNSQAIQTAIQKGIQIYSQTKLFFDLCPCPIIGVTGTKGKGTTSSLIFKILVQGKKRAWLAGNIGKDPFEFIDELKPDDIVVLELSSFQLQDIHRSPHIAVVLNITSDHVNPNLEMATHYTQEEYIGAKSNIIKFQTDSDFAILHRELPDWFKSLGSGKKIYIDPSTAESYTTKLIGNHNHENIAAAIAVGKLLLVNENDIRKAVAEFEPLPHRLQIVGTNSGITYVDDSISTNVDSTIAAIKSFDKPT